MEAAGAAEGLSVNPFEVIGTELPKYARSAAEQQAGDFRGFANMLQPPQVGPKESGPEWLMLYWRAIVDAMLRGSQGVPPTPQAPPKQLPSQSGIRG